jgi:rare lipoprotein A (peptidoglycan hydrolase)
VLRGVLVLGLAVAASVAVGDHPLTASAAPHLTPSSAASTTLIGSAGRLPHDVTTTSSTSSTTTTLPNRPQQGSHRWRVGYATWYRWHPGQCAVSYLRYGVYIKVTSRRTGRHVWCKVTDSQPYSKTRVVDLSTTGFQKLAPLSRGMEPVIVTW